MTFQNAISISLDNSQPFAVRDELPSWKIEFMPPCEEVDTWNEIFHITERYRRDILDVEFKTWLKGFKAWCRPKGISNSNAALLEALKHYLESLEESGFQDRAFLKLAVFRMLEKHCREGNERLSTLLRELAVGVVV